MPLYLDIHLFDDGVAVADVAQVHMADLHTQGKHEVRYLRYWVASSRARCSAWSRPRLLRRPRPYTATPMAWSPMRSTRCRKAPDRPASGRIRPNVKEQPK